MKFIILVRILWTAGAQKIAINEAKELKKTGVDVELIFLRRGKSWEAYEELLSDINYSVVSDREKSLFSWLYNYITGLFAQDRKGDGRIDYDLLRKFPKIIKNKGIDKIICHDEWAGLAGYLAKKKLGIPYEVFLHERLGNLNVPILGAIAERYRLKILKNASRVYSITEKIAHETLTRFSISSIPNPPGFEILGKIDPQLKKDRIISISMWDKGRNPFFFIELGKMIKEYEIMLLGNWRDQEYYNLFISSIPDNSNMVVKTNVSESEKYRLVRESKFLVRFGMLEFGPAMAVLESISCGTPVIINDVLGTADIIKEYNAGFVVSEADTKSIADVVINTKQEDYQKLLNNVNELRKSWTWVNHIMKLL